MKSITLQGFKSFANKTKLEFLGSNEDRKSITAIVGPNGSGKSNISDAIRWVMGEQSLSNLRAKTNEDIIFNGSEAKRKTSRASVKIVLDNSDNKVDIERDEITIERRYYRSGESSYLLNGEEVRLMDLRLFLAKANFAQSSYSVVGQGMVNNIVMQSAKERKGFFDEAFGIKQYQIKRHKAWLKLQRSEDNIQEVKMVLKDKKPKLRSLKKKVDKLEKKKKLKLELEELREKYFTTLYKKRKKEQEALESEVKKLKEKEEKLEQEIKETKENLAELAENKSKDEFEQLQKKHQDIISQKNKLEEEKAVVQGKLQTEYSQAGKQNIGWIENKLSNLKDDKQEVKEGIESIKPELEEYSQKIEQKQKKLEEIEYKISALEGKISNIKDEISSHSSSSHLTSIRAIDELLKNKRKFDGLFGTLAQLGRVEDKFQLAVDIAAGSQLSSLVVEDENVAQQCIDYLKENRLGYATFLPLEKLDPYISDISKFNHPKIYDLAINLVDFDPKYTQAFKYTLGSTLIIEDIQTAKEISIGRIRMVTLEGDVLNKSGSITGGHRKNKQNLSFGDSSKKINIGKKKEELKQKQDELDQLNEQKNDIQSELSKLKNKRQKKKNKEELLKEKKEVIQKEVDDLQSDLDLAQMDPEEYSENLEDLRARKEEIESQIEKYKQQAQKISKKIEKFNEQEEEKKKRMFNLQDELQEKQLELKDLQNKIKNKKKRLEKIQTKQRDVSQEVKEVLNITIKELLDKNVDTLDWSNKNDAKEEIQELKYKLDLIGEIDPKVKDEYEELKQECDNLEEQLNDLEEAMKDSKELIKELDETMKEKRENSFREIKDKFEDNFQTLFGGGKADLNRVYGEKEEQIESSQEAIVGIEIEASPPKKNVDNIRTLSGGEKTLTALALICAIINTNPSPFIVLDEVEATLDEANTDRFIDILEELAQESQFILITHNRTTMHAADALYGVTMDSGVSDVVSLKLEEAEQV
ncbi:MAG: AAA family ATPase, partial [Candidatus Magasanikbacteria bacterium]